MKVKILFAIILLALYPAMLFAAGTEKPKTISANPARDGSSIEKAIIIKYITDYKKSINQEFEYIKNHFGVIGQDLQINGQSLVAEKNKYYDQIGITLMKSKEVKTLYFDITEPFNQMMKQIPPAPIEKPQTQTK